MFRTYFASLLRPASLLILLFLILISVALYFFGGIVTVAGITPFANMEPRILAIVVLFVLFFLITFLRHFLARRANAKLINSMLANDELVSMGPDMSADEVELIRERFEAALKKLRDNPLDGKRNRNFLFELPWYIIIGPPGTGKTTILRNSGLEFPLAENGQEALQGVGGTRNCDWWISNEAVMIDTAGRYTTQDVNKGVDAAAWSGFLELLLKFRRRRPINGILLAISIEDVALADEDARSRQAEILRQRLRELHRTFGMRLPVYIMFTKCDLIAGFDEYFDGIKERDREQVWGVTLPYDQQQMTFGPAFEQGFTDLVARLEKQLPERLSEERNNGRRCRIYGFPHEFGTLSTVLRSFVSEVFRSSRYEAQPLLRGVYFTSGTQEGTPFDRLLGAMGNSFQLAPAHQMPLSGQGKAYFIKNLLSNIVFREQDLVGVNTRLERRLAAIYAGSMAAIVAVVVGLSAYWLAGLYHADETADEVEELANRLRVMRQDADRDRSLISILPTLNAAKAMRDEIKEEENWLTVMPFSIESQSKLYPAAEKTYESYLREYLLPSITSRLEAQIQLVSNAANSNSTLLRDQLETYLMLTTGQNYNASKVQSAFRAQNEAAFILNPENRGAMQEHMNNLLQLLPIQAAVDQPIVQEARDRIQQVPQASSIYNRMVTDSAQRYRVAPVNLTTSLGSGALYIDSATSQGRSLIPGFYTKNGFYNFFLARLPEYIRSSTGSDWVLGNQVSDTTYNRLAKEIVRMYTQDYIRTWREGISYIRVVDIGSLGRAQIVLQDLSSPQSPLTNVLSILRENTQLPLPGSDTQSQAAGAAANAAPAAAGGIVASASEAAQKAAVQTAFGDAPWPGIAIEDAFRPLNNLTDPTAGQQSLDRVQQLFGDLYGNVAGVVTAPDPNKAAFDFVKGRAQTPTNDSFTTLRSEAAIKPEPVRSMVLSIVNRTWDLLNKSAYLYLNGRWKDEVVPACNSIIAGRYPFDPGAKEDVALQDFTDLLGPSGVIDAYFNNYLKPFVLIRGRQYTEVQTQGAGLGLSAEALNQISTAQTIKDAFFAKGGSSPEAKFTIRPSFLDPKALRSTLKIDDETMIYRHGPVRSKDFSWPSQADASVAQLSITLLDNSKDTVQQEGTWAIFRLLSESGLSRVTGQDRFVFSITKDVKIEPKPQVPPAPAPNRDTQGEVEKITGSFALIAGSVVNPFNLGLYSSFRCPASL
ncbi:type VI secretion system membrane subunit TssM [Roseibium denhamense]|uniref:Type VI secretion system protein ImpL n=1 Tax=Roseibium denhamense TaxID=76305 RepID=A0ABY1NZL3_9HYPH|nr:type VI secretion system membrane subunit TssM [Roseibium denhamense]MTI04861.1 type VI secretion system membrane subunit TssM [Roseibium denhamense]SMP20049.1 type VI secretion system protein ImpL [Roseibium denhamense]